MKSVYQFKKVDQIDQIIFCNPIFYMVLLVKTKFCPTFSLEEKQNHCAVIQRTAVDVYSFPPPDQIIFLYKNERAT